MVVESPGKAASGRPREQASVAADQKWRGLNDPGVPAMSLVSVIVPTYNRRDNPGRDRSVQGQTFADWELIVVDDGSTTTRRPDRGLDPRSSLSGKNQGVNAARTLPCPCTRPVHRFLDSDDEWLPHTWNSAWHFSGRFPGRTSSPGNSAESGRGALIPFLRSALTGCTRARRAGGLVVLKLPPGESDPTAGCSEGRADRGVGADIVARILSRRASVPGRVFEHMRFGFLFAGSPLC